MFFFNNSALTDEEYSDILKFLIAHWENEIVEFKSATGNYNVDKIGQYFSAISNEANLKEKRCGWLVLGVSENAEHRIVGTNFKQGRGELLEKFKYEISKNTTDNITFMDVAELRAGSENKRVLMFKIPAATLGIPTAWKNCYYARSGESLVSLQQNKIDIIRSQERLDWSKRFVSKATIEHLDKTAISLAREQYKARMKRPHISEEVEELNDEEFLTKTKLVIDGNITNAAMILLGNSDFDYLFERAPEIMWRLCKSDGEVKDYEIYKIPFLGVVDKLFEKIRNLTYRYMPNQLSLFPTETEQYDRWLLRELLNNCIAHSDYRVGGRIYVNEFEDYITICNPGDFLPLSIENVLKAGYNPPFYRNQLLADAMVNFNMIDTATSGIKKVYRIQKDKFFPLPDYDLSQSTQVTVKIYGKQLDEKYSFILFGNPKLNIETVYLLDQVQKGHSSLLSNENVAFLRKNNLVEGRKGRLYLSAEVAEGMSKEASYIKNRGFDDNHYRKMIISYLEQFKKASRRDIASLLWDKLPDALSDKQKNVKITTLLTYLRKKNIIMTDSDNHQKSCWILTKK